MSPYTSPTVNSYGQTTGRGLRTPLELATKLQNPRLVKLLGSFERVRLHTGGHHSGTFPSPHTPIRLIVVWSFGAESHAAAIDYRRLQLPFFLSFFERSKKVRNFRPQLKRASVYLRVLT